MKNFQLNFAFLVFGVWVEIAGLLYDLCKSTVLPAAAGG